MQTHRVKPVCVAIAAMLCVAAPAAFSEMYRWVDEHGTVTYSNHLPPEPSLARDVTIVEDASAKSSPIEQRTKEIIDAERGGQTARGVPIAPGASGTLPETAISGDAPPAPRISIAPGAPEAVRDPCLRSSDPKCPEKNRGNYVPYRGYSPSAAGMAAGSTAVGASSSAAGGGSVAGGTSVARPPLTAPKSSTYALPPGSEAPVRKP
jgi:hypothetical protein